MVTIFKGIGRKETILRADTTYYGKDRGEDASRKDFVGNLTYRQMKSMYEINPWVRACVDRIRDRAANVNPIIRATLKKGKNKPTDDQYKRIEEIHKIIMKPNSMKESFQTILKKVFKDVLIYDAGSIELVRDLVNKQVAEIYVVDGSSVRFNVTKDGLFKNNDEAFYQVDPVNYKTVLEKFSMDEICYMIMNPSSDSMYGVSPLETLVNTVTADLYASEFNIQRFMNDATPKFAVLVSGAGMDQGGAIIRRFQEYWNSELKGQPHKPLFLSTDGGEIKLVTTGLTNEEMQYQQYSQWLMSKILSVYKVPPFIIGIVDGTTGKLNSKQQDLTFKKDAIYPLLQMFSWHFNREIIWDDNGYNYDDIYLHWEGSDFEDREALSKIHETYLRNGVFTINMVLNELGQDGVPWGDTPYIQKQYVPIGMLSAEEGSDAAVKTFLNSLGYEDFEINDAYMKLFKMRDGLMNDFFRIPLELGGSE